MNSKILVFGMILILFLFFGCTKAKENAGNESPANNSIQQKNELPANSASATEPNEWDNAELPSFDFGKYNDSLGDLNA